MRRLILMRHAKAVPQAPDGDDFDRPLEARGRREAAGAARLLADLGLAPDIALVSTAKRTAETWEIVAKTLPAGAVAATDALYAAAPEAVLAAVRRAGESPAAETILVVGHNPGLKILAAALTAGPGPHAGEARARLALGLPTSWAAIICFDNSFSDTAGRLDALLGPERGG